MLCTEGLSPGREFAGLGRVPYPVPLSGFAVTLILASFAHGVLDLCNNA